MIHVQQPNWRWLSALGVGLTLALGWVLGCSDAMNGPNDSPQAMPAHTLQCGQISFVVGFERGQALARSQGKPMLVFFRLDDCPFSAAMVNETFSEAALARAADRFVCVLVNADDEPKACAQFDVRAFPVVQFVTPQGAPISHLVGKQPASRVMTEMQSALQQLARRNRESLVR